MPRNTGRQFQRRSPADRITVSAASNGNRPGRRSGRGFEQSSTVGRSGDPRAGDTASTAADGIITIGPLTPTGPAVNCGILPAPPGAEAATATTGTDDGDTGIGGDTGDIGFRTHEARNRRAGRPAPAPGQPTTEARPATRHPDETLLTYGSQIGAGTQSGRRSTPGVERGWPPISPTQTGFPRHEDLMFLSTRSLGDDTRPRGSVGSRLERPALSGSTGRCRGSGQQPDSGGSGGHYRISPTAVAGLLADIGRFRDRQRRSRLEVDALAVGSLFRRPSRRGGCRRLRALRPARPTISAAGETDAQRRLYGLTVSARFDAGSVSVAPFARVSGYREEDRGRRTRGGARRGPRNASAPVGARVDFQTGHGRSAPGLSPVAADAWRFDDGTTETEATTPRRSPRCYLTFDTGTGRVTADIASLRSGRRRPSLAGEPALRLRVLIRPRPPPPGQPGGRCAILSASPAARVRGPLRYRRRRNGAARSQPRIPMIAQPPA